MVERKHPLANCQECPWYEHSGYADSSGPSDAKIVIVGEAPGKKECQTGEPFTGPSGKLLDRVLSHHKFDRSEIRFTNVVACHPRFAQGKKPEVPPKEAIAACKPRLSAELQSREVIIALGNTAKQAILDTREGISKVRQGPAKTHPLYPGARIVATVHPASCLRTSDNFPDLVKDIKKAKSTASINWEPPVYKVVDDEQSACAVIDELLRRPGYCTVDIETGADKDTDLTHPYSILCVGIGYDRNKVVVIGENAIKSQRVRDRLTTFFEVKDVICHNGKFDIQVLLRFGIIKRARQFADTMLSSYALDERPGHHSLDGRGAEELGTPDWKAELKPHLGKGKNKNYANVPRPLLYRYNAYDAAVTYNLWLKDEVSLAEAGLRGLHDFLVEASNELIYLELGGVGIDQEYLDVLDEEYALKLYDLELELNPWVENPRSWQQVQKALKGLMLPSQSTEAAVLMELLQYRAKKDEQKEFLVKMLNYRKEAKLYGTYIKGTKKRLTDGRLFTTFKLHGTVTGRLSSANPNLQNIPRGPIIKKLFVPGDGNVFLQADYKQAEWRAIACLARDSYLQGALGDPNRDIHGEVAAKFYGPNYTKEQRVMAKTFVFGVAYGRGPDAIAKAFNVSVYEAERYIKEFFGLIPDVVKWRKEIHSQLFGGGQSLQTPFGRKRRYGLITRENKHDIEKEALAFMPQSIASDLTLNSLIRMRRQFGDEAPVRITVHDSIMVECAEDVQADVGREMVSIMKNTAAEVFSDFVPFEADVESGHSWGDLSEVTEEVRI